MLILTLMIVLFYSSSVYAQRGKSSPNSSHINYWTESYARFYCPQTGNITGIVRTHYMHYKQPDGDNTVHLVSHGDLEDENGGRWIHHSVYYRERHWYYDDTNMLISTAHLLGPNGEHLTFKVRYVMDGHENRVVNFISDSMCD